ncbi:glycosyltransferase family 2 protein [Streptomyces sp. ISL-90]|nr:glycosyltransferase family 2 protein [Streptomyces sp. ISL-90]
MTQSPLVAIVIVTYNSADVILDCLRSLGDFDSRELEIIVVDNNSTDDTVTAIRALHSEVRIIANESNAGFAEAVNTGVAQARGSSILLLNPDATISRTTVMQLREAIVNDPTIGLIAPFVSDPTGRVAVISAGEMPTAWRVFCHYSGLSRLAGNRAPFAGQYLIPDKSMAGTIDVEWTSGACMLFLKETWHEAGGLSTRWFMYAEDVDFCWRILKRGLRIVVDFDLHATHLVGSSSKGNPLESSPSWIVNLYDFYKTELARSWMQALAWKLTVAGGLYARGVVYRLRSLSSKSDGAAWSNESTRFRRFAVAVMQLRAYEAGG